MIKVSTVNRKEFPVSISVETNPKNQKIEDELVWLGNTFDPIITVKVKGKVTQENPEQNSSPISLNTIAYRDARYCISTQ